MRSISVFKKSGIYSLPSVWGGFVLLLAGCSSPSFVNPPPKTYLMPLPTAIEGIWSNVEDNGERVRLSGQSDSTLRMYFFNTDLSRNFAPAEPLLAQTLRFDNTDWLLLDWNNMAAWQGEQAEEKSPFKILKYALENPDRLCGSEIDSGIFAEAINSRKLTGNVERSGPTLPENLQSLSVSVTSPADDWVKWWSSLPASQKKFGQKWCFRRVG